MKAGTWLLFYRNKKDHESTRNNYANKLDNLDENSQQTPRNTASPQTEL